MIRHILGDDIDPALRPLLAVQLFGSLAQSSLYTFIGIWALRRLHAGETLLGTGFLLAAVAAMLAGYVGGHLSDHHGRRPLILTGWAGQASCAFLLLAVTDHVWAGLSVLVLSSALGSLGGAADSAMVADVVPPEGVERAYATLRVVANLGTTAGPVLGAALLATLGWSGLFTGSGLIALTGGCLALRFVPRRGAYAPPHPPERGSFGALRSDRRFRLFFVAGCLSTMVYVAFESLLPISLTQEHGLQPSTWGYLVVINPALVSLLQLRLTRAVSRVAPVRRLVAAMLLMGLPFLLLDLNASVPVAGVVITVFVVGEMLWVPTSQAVVAELAPEDLRGAYMGAFGSTFSVGFAIAPFVGLQVLHRLGDGAMWGMIALVSLAAAAAYVVADGVPAPREATVPS